MVVHDGKDDGPGIFNQQCSAGACGTIGELLGKVGRDVSRSLLLRAEVTLIEEGVDETRHLCELHPMDFDALRLPALLKSRLRRVRERGGKIPEDLMGHGPGDEAEDGAKSAPSPDSTAADDGGDDTDPVMENYGEGSAAAADVGGDTDPEMENHGGGFAAAHGGGGDTDPEMGPYEAL